ncbi:sugar ABC transporter substrate-binding protein [Paenibacillus beijingensis]|uniref:Maltodextrin-binding protein n=1 Tax=Paenibacillus beijingensis TaxID=1126833 RepID=A0A0D5NF07_9BACL|nr:extracellular solute-binding protein [Paenibacillus beijingensis]AJY73821.1 hypothetical protein VN24_03220 [Paenibacillus beijingensis]
MKKKLGLLALSAVMTFTLAACGGKTNSANTGNEATNGTGQQNEAAANEELKPEPGAELKLWTIKDDFTENAAKEFEQKYNIKVTTEDVTFWDSPARLATDGPAGMGADVFGMTNDFLGGAVGSGLVLPNDYFEEETKSITRKDAIDASTFEGVLYGYPRSVYTYALYVNKDLVKDVKLDTWDDIITFAKKFNDEKNNKYAYMFDTGSFFLFSYLAGYGGYVFGNNETDPKDIGINNEGAVKGMQFIQSLKEILPLKFSDMNVDIKTGLFESGKLAINMDGSWNMAKFSKLPFNVTVIPMPPMPGDKAPVTLAGTTSYYVSAYSKYPNAAKLFANFLTSKENQAKAVEVTGEFPAAEGVDNRTDEIPQGFQKQLANSRMWSNLPEMKYFGQYLDPAFTAVWEGADVKTTLDKAAAGMKSSIENQK